ncbi:extracellular solute-binding protein, partial [Enterococcus faecalis]
MENLVSADEINRSFIPSAITASKYKGVSYGFPVSFSTLALFYNKDLLEKKPRTFEEIIDFSANFNDAKENKYGL